MIRVALLSCVLVIFNIICYGQSKETFDIATYQVPPGWNRETTDYAVSFSKVNNTSRGWCRVSIYKSIASAGDPLTDFNNEWSALISKNYPDAVMPKPEQTTEDGWTSVAGVATFKFSNAEAYALLTTITGYATEMSIVVLTNSDEFMKEVEKFLGSLDLKKPTVTQTTQQSGGTTTNHAKTNTSSNSTSVSSAPGKNGISISTTNFDDGWVAQPFADYCKVTKNNITVLLHYGIPITDELRNSNNIEGTIFDQFILPRYTISNLRQFQNGQYEYFKIYFYEADAVEKSSGKRYYIGFRIITENAISRCIEIISPTVNDFQSTFPNQEKVAAMLNYNKFAVTANDLAGKWDESTFSGVDMYNTTTGNYAGMSTASAANSFTFHTDKTYASTHKGAFGMTGNMKFYDQKYTGKLTVTNWDITMTNRFEGKTDVFWAQFEAVRGGRVLHITDKNASGIRYHLVRIGN